MPSYSSGSNSFAVTGTSGVGANPGETILVEFPADAISHGGFTDSSKVTTVNAYGGTGSSGNGGSATIEDTDPTLRTTPLSLTAQGGTGANGGAATVTMSGTSSTTAQLTLNATGAQGTANNGIGGNATVSFTGNTLTTTSADIELSITVHAGQSNVSTSTGVAALNFSNNQITGSSQNDYLSLSIATTGSTKSITSVNNVYDGGDGFDTLHIYGSASDWSIQRDSYGVFEFTDLDINPGVTFKAVNVEEVQFATSQAYEYLDPALFFGNADNVNFNSLTDAQQAAVSSGSDLYHALGGNDTILLPSLTAAASLGWNYATTFDAGDGNDSITGASNSGNMRIEGGAGDDYILVQSGTNYIDGGSGNDTIHDGGIGDTVLGGDGNDTLYIGGSGTTVDAGAGDDNIILYGGSLAGLTGGAGTDTVTFDTSSVTLNMTQFSAASSGIENLVITEPSTAVFGNDSGENFDFSGFTINAGLTIVGGAANDTLIGTNQNDTLSGGAGNNTLNGGAGTDTVRYALNLYTPAGPDNGASYGYAEQDGNALYRQSDHTLLYSWAWNGTALTVSHIEATSLNTVPTTVSQVYDTDQLTSVETLDFYTYSGPGTYGDLYLNFSAGDNGNNNITPGAGTLYINGAGGTDTVIYAGKTSSYTITHNSDHTVTINGTFSGQTDILTSVEFAQFSDGTVSLTRQARNDFDGDGKSDILWQNSNGTAAVWLLNGSALAGGNTVGNPGSASWHAIGTGDFDGDGKADILWQNSDGTPAVWLMNGTTVAGGGIPGTNPGTAWTVLGAADFDGDGKSDILWRAADGSIAAWLMNGSTLTGGAVVGNPGAGWSYKGTGDFNGDGKTDILFQNNDGSVAVWLMNGASVSNGAVVGKPSGTFQVKAAGDFDGDGKSDILFQDATGQVAIWLMNGTTLAGGGLAGTNPGTTWTVKQAEDVNGDGKADILWQAADGSPAAWLMNGTSLTGGGIIGTNPGTSWHIVTG